LWSDACGSKLALFATSNDFLIWNKKPSKNCFEFWSGRKESLQDKKQRRYHF
jgi:hypothetical protein